MILNKAASLHYIYPADQGEVLKSLTASIIAHHVNWPVEFLSWAISFPTEVN